MDWQALVVLLGLGLGLVLKYKTGLSNKFIPALILAQSLVVDFVKAAVDGGNMPPLDGTLGTATGATGTAMLIHGLSAGLIALSKKVKA